MKKLWRVHRTCVKIKFNFWFKFALWVDVIYIIYIRPTVILHVFNFIFVHVRSFFLDRICFLHHASLVSCQFAWTELSFVLVGQSVVQVYCFCNTWTTTAMAVALFDPGAAIIGGASMMTQVRLVKCVRFDVSYVRYVESWSLIQHRRLVHKELSKTRLLQCIVVCEKFFTTELRACCMWQVYCFPGLGKYIRFDEKKNVPSTPESESAVEQAVTETRVSKRIRRN